MHPLKIVALSVLVTLGILGLAGGAAAQDVSSRVGSPASPSNVPRTFGTASEVVQVISAWSFQDSDGSGLPAIARGERVCGAAIGACRFIIGVQLPAGALVRRLELEACDTNASEIVEAVFYRFGPPSGGTLPEGEIMAVT